MNRQFGLERLEDVLDAYVASGAGPNDPLDEWVQSYPEYEEEIIDFAVSWSLMNSLPPAPDVEEVDEETLVLRGMSVVQNLLHVQSLEDSTGPVTQLTSLVKEGQAHGLNPHQLAQEAELGAALLRKLDRRLIRYPSIPQELIEVLVRTIHSEITRVEAYLQQSPTFATATEHRSEQAPVLIEQEDFFDAVRADPTINREHAARWLKLEHSKGIK